jgi:hypothetical protein
MLTAGRTQKTDDPVILYTFSLSGMLTSYPVDFGGVVAVMKRRCKGSSPVSRERTGTKDLKGV